MTVASIEANIAKGRGIAARVLAHLFAQYRPSNPLAPLATVLTTMPVLFTPQADAFRAPNMPSRPWWFAEVDTRLTQPGDVFVGAAGTWFIFSQQQYTAPLCAQTNRIVSVLTPQTASAADGLNGYSGTTATNSTPLLTGWPASILIGTKGERGTLQEPGDSRSPWWAITLPATLGVQIKHGCIVVDDLGRRFTVSAAELTDGWRITAQQDVT